MAAKAESPPRVRTGFSQRVKEALDDSPLSLTEVAGHCEVTPQALSNITNPPKGRNVQGCRFANKLAKTLGVSVDWLLYGEGLRNPQGLQPVMPRPNQALALDGLTPLQVGALHSLADLMKGGRLSDAAVATLLHQVHSPAPG